ncbi:hypothetical protein B0T25DRAFT_55183 [Lasiosphaeria hispida]|uniref:Chromo shadow domain-containing protein n=1 Tax=Lasiosphaeria hispida TaxID=260671 RepID=A0AAJ0HVX5_9PEZI|nr:hypothetical protein B0T25DRAFT_55183 [Lasiosphaeria hispida]
MVYLTWKNSHKTRHETSVIYPRCPQKMLPFYERHVRIFKRVRRGLCNLTEIRPRHGCLDTGMGNEDSDGFIRIRVGPGTQLQRRCRFSR